MSGKAGMLKGAAALAVRSLAPGQRVARSLPAPEGPWAVGTLRAVLRDEGRRDPFADTPGPRVFPIQVWYPAVAGGAKASYLPAAGMAALLTGAMGLPPILGGLDRLRTHAYRDAPFQPAAGACPVLLFSHGYTGFEGQNTLQMEHLASHGYVVASVCHPFEAFGAYLDDEKRLIPISAKRMEAFKADARENMARYDMKTDSPQAVAHMARTCKVPRESAAVWTQDMLFAVSRLARWNGEEGHLLEGRLAMKSMGVFGHSFGGAVAGEVALRDGRFRCFCNMDGVPFGMQTQRAPNLPCMLLTSGSYIRAGYGAGLESCLEVAFKGARHFDFSDFTYLSPAIKKSRLLLGEIAPDIQIGTLNRYLRGFFDVFVKGADRGPELDPAHDDGVTVKEGALWT